MKNTAYTLLALFAFLLILVDANSCANTTAAPTGGDKDTLPPVLLGTVPLQNALNFPLTGGTVELKFNEYTQVKTPAEVYVAPPQRRKAGVKMKGKSVVVTFNDTLKADRTYTVDFGNALADNNEGNPFKRYVFTFSTGDYIDSMYITGTVMDAEKLLPAKGMLVAVYDSLQVEDGQRAVPFDSLVLLKPPYSATRTDDWGFFTLRNIPPKKFRIYAIEDLNSNNIFDPETERIAFNSSFFVPENVMRDSIPELLFYDMKDTLGCNSRIPMFNLLMYKEETSRQRITNTGRISNRECFIKFMSPNPDIDTLYFSGIRDKHLIRSFNSKGDSLSLWITDKGFLPDTLFAHIRYMMTDSTGNLSLATEDFKMAVDKSLQKKDATGRIVKDTTVQMTVTAQGETVEQNGYLFEFGQPLEKDDFNGILHFKISPRGDTTFISHKVTKDTINPKRYTLIPEDTFEKGWSYHITVPKGTFIDINGLPNDSTAVKVELPSDEDLSLMQLILTGVKTRYIVDLVNEKRDKVYRSYVIDSDCTLDFPYLREDKYSVRITEDRNRNGKIDTGNLLENKQPEKVLMADFGDRNYVMEVKSRTDYEQEFNLEDMFK